MPVSRTTLHRYLTAAELTLVEESYAPALTMLSVAGLKSRITRTRRLRKKYQDIAASQVREMKGAKAPARKRPAASSRNAATRAKILAEALGRFEGQLKKAEASEKAEKAKAGLAAALKRKTKKGAVKDGAARTPAKAPSAKPNPKVQTFPNLQTMKGAARANFARSQSKRDARKG